MRSDPTSVFRALSDETRLMIVALLLTHGELCGCELEAVLGITQSKTSRHLRYLLNSGLVLDRRVGPSIYYRIADYLTSPTRAVLRFAASQLDEIKLADLSLKIREFQNTRCSAAPGEKHTSARVVKSEVER